MGKTLIVYAPNKKLFTSWVRNYGVYFKDLNLVWADCEDSLKGWFSEETYWTKIDGWEEGPFVETKRAERFKFCDATAIETKVDEYLKKNPRKLMIY